MQFHLLYLNWWRHSVRPISAPSPIATMASGLFWHMDRCLGLRPGILLQITLAPRATTDDMALLYVTEYFTLAISDVLRYCATEINLWRLVLLTAMFCFFSSVLMHRTSSPALSPTFCLRLVYLCVLRPFCISFFPNRMQTSQKKIPPGNQKS